VTGPIWNPGNIGFWPVVLAQSREAMQQPIQPAASQRGMASTIAAASAAVGAVLLLGALALWAHYGTAVFFEMLASGIAACF
jgi:hypothetical protein